MNNKYGTSDPYEIRVSFQGMLQHNAGYALLGATCSCLQQKTLYHWLIPTAERFVRDSGCINQESKSVNLCLSFSGFPESIQKLDDFTKHILVTHVRGVLATTVHGRHLIEMPMVTMSENYSENRSWNGKFSKHDILIIKRCERRGFTTYETYEMKILQKPMELEGQRLREAMVRDLKEVAEIFIPLYEMDGDYPVHFLEFSQTLKSVKEGFVADIWFMKYLTHHPVIMSPAGRRTFWIKLHHALVDYNNKQLRAELTACPYDWNAIVESDFKAVRLTNKGIITALWEGVQSQKQRW